MLPDLLTALALAFPIVEASPGVTGPCPGAHDDDRCEDVEHWDPLRALNAAAIPSDGMLVLQGIHDGPWDEGVASRVEVKVELDFQPVTVSLEIGPMNGLLIWRPETARAADIIPAPAGRRLRAGSEVSALLSTA